jgi:phage terminase large subunit-like protein
VAAPGTLAHFRAWAKTLILDTGEPWIVEPFQAKIVKDILAGYEVVWVVLPEGNAKTTLMAGIALYHGDSEGWNVPSPEVPIGASSREQAEIMYRQAEGFVLRSGLEDRFKCQEGYRRIKCLGTNGRIQVYAADARTGDGVIPTLALLDELHRHRDLRLYRTWRGKLGKRKGQLGVISTAGEPDSDFEETRASILDGAKKITAAAPTPGPRPMGWCCTTTRSGT